jgi:pteridine reductase
MDCTACTVNLNPEIMKSVSVGAAKDLSGNCALVTGAAKRIGAAIVRTLHAEGVNVAIHYRSSATEAELLRDELNRKRNASAHCFQADLRVTGEISRLMEDVHNWQRRLDILVNNASTFYPTVFGQITEEHWSDLMESKVKGPLFLSQAAAPYLLETAGTIVNIVDIHAQRPLRDHMVYCSAKAALVMLTKSLAKELAPGVRVNGIAPGAIAWPEDGMADSTKDSIVRQIPLGRTGSPQDIADCVIFLARDATYSSGHIMAIDGGRSVGW